jgi:hypothetical protein
MNLCVKYENGAERQENCSSHASIMTRAREWLELWMEA